MKHCRAQIEALVALDPRMRRAVDNLVADCCDDQANPHGNIPLVVQASIETDCAAHGPDATDHIPAVVAQRRAIAEPKPYRAAPAPPEELRRSMSLQTFAAWHLSGSGGYDAFGSVDALMAELDGLGERSLPLFALRGSTGRLGDPSWWTWHAGEAGEPRDGATYLAELAMGEGERARAESDGRVVALRLTAARLGQPLYKPSALDAFGPDSLFGPDLTDSTCGWTCPQGDGLSKRPELVSPSVPYEDIAAGDSQVDLTLYPYRAAGMHP